MRERRPELLIPASSLEVLKTAVILRRGCSLYRRRGVRPAGKGEEFFHGRDEGGASPLPMNTGSGSM